MIDYIIWREISNVHIDTYWLHKLKIGDLPPQLHFVC